MTSCGAIRRPRLTLIAALASNGVIGADNAMPWRLPADLQRFKALTMGHSIIMGRKTWESLARPLPGRRNIVVSRNAACQAAGATLVGSLAAALEACAGEQEAFVIGGAEIYAQALPLADCLQLTEIHRDFAGDTRFPTFDRTDWREVARARQAGPEFEYDFVTYHRT